MPSHLLNGSQSNSHTPPPALKALPFYLAMKSPEGICETFLLWGKLCKKNRGGEHIMSGGSDLECELENKRGDF